MSTLIEQADAFREYVAEHSSQRAGLSLAELFRRWQATNQTEEELSESLASLQRGLDDAESGRTQDAAGVIAEARAKFRRK